MVALPVLLGALPGSSETIVEADFGEGSDGFSYVDDAFLGTRAPDYARGRAPTGPAVSGEVEGALGITLGGVDSQTVRGISGGWRRAFRLESTTHDLTISFRYRMVQSWGYEPDEFSQVMVSLDGVPLQGRGADHVERMVGDGDEGEDRTTGWRAFSSNEGSVAAGRHVLTIGGYNSKKTVVDETTRIWIDDVRVTGTPEPTCRWDRDCDDANACTDDTCVAGRCVHRGNTRSCPDGFDYGD